MRLTIRAKLVGGYLMVVAMGAAVSLGILTTLSRSVDRLEQVVQRDDEVSRKSAEMRLAMAQMGEATRALLLDPTSQMERQKKVSSDEAFGRIGREIAALTQDPAVQQKLRQVVAMDETELNPIEDQIEAMLTAHDLPGAQKKYAEEYLPTRARVETLISEIGDSTEQAKIEAVWSAGAT